MKIRPVTVALLSLALLAALPYLAGGGLRNFITLDDGNYVYDNQVVLKGITWGGLRWAFTAFELANWHPLTWLSHMLDVSLFGTAAWGHHLTSVLLHALNTALLALVLARLTGKFWPAWCAAALFGVHPLRVESVAWVAERKDVLSGLFFLLLLLAYERYARRGGAGRYLLVATLLALGLMAKPMLVTAPFVLLLLDWWPLGRMRAAGPAGDGVAAPRPWKRVVVEKIPLLALSAASCAVTFMAQRAGGAIAALTGLPVGERAANALVSYGAYLGKTAWPTSLAVYYPYSQTAHPLWQTIGAVFVLASATLVVLVWSRSRPYLAVGWLWFLGMLVPVIGMVQVGSQALADRYTYLPAVGLALLLVWGMPEVFGRLHLGAPALRAVAALVLAVLTAATLTTAERWKDSEKLYRQTLAVTSGNWVIHYSLGFLFREQGRRAEAIAEFQEALRWRPDYPEAFFILGLSFQELGRFEEAVASYRGVLKMHPDFLEAHEKLGIVLYILGRRTEAEYHIREVQKIRAQRDRGGA